MKYLLTIIGPTAIGKTALSIKLAQHFQCEIISADSRQFYKEMAIGTAVPDHNELSAASHHFIQHKSIHDSFTVGDFEKEAIARLNVLFKENNFAILVGGSGLYIDAIVKGLDEFPDVPANVRQSVTEKYNKNGIEWLKSQLQILDPEYYEKVDTGNPQRMMRALEVCLASQKPYSSFLKGGEKTRDFTPIFIGLEAPREEMYNRINQRVESMIENGLLEEAKSLHPNKQLNALQTVGYRELFSYFDNEITFDFAVSEIKKNTRRFAKRQLTWFKRNSDTIWFDYKTDLDAITNAIAQQIKSLE